MYDLKLIQEFDGSDERRGIRAFNSAVHSLAMSKDEMHLLVGLGNGEVCIYTPDAQYLRERLQKKLSNLGF